MEMGNVKSIGIKRASLAFSPIAKAPNRYYAGHARWTYFVRSFVFNDHGGC